MIQKMHRSFHSSVPNFGPRKSQHLLARVSCKSFGVVTVHTGCCGIPSLSRCQNEDRFHPEKSTSRAHLARPNPQTLWINLLQISVCSQRRNCRGLTGFLPKALLEAPSNDFLFALKGKQEYVVQSFPFLMFATRLFLQFSHSFSKCHELYLQNYVSWFICMPMHTCTQICRDGKLML